MSKKERSYNPLQGLSREDTFLSHHKIPRTQLEALLLAAPGQTISPSQEERVALRETVVGALDTLDEWELWLINVLLFERLSLRQVEYITGIPKTTVARQRDKVLKKLRAYLYKEPLVLEHLGITPPPHAHQKSS